MLTLPEFQLLRPTTIDEAVSMLAEHPAARLVGGGTDLLVNMKHGVTEADTLVDVTAIPGLDEITAGDGGGLTIGATARLADAAHNGLVQRRFPSLAEALAQVAGPQLRNMGTFGGNVCLDTRCVYINQTHFWRRSLGYCLKKDGDGCHVVKAGKRCVAAQSSDSVPVLVSLGAEARLVGPAGERIAPLESLYRRNGEAHLTLAADEILVSVTIPGPANQLSSAYRKLRVRKAIDYPALSIAGAVERDGDQRVTRIAVVGTALMATPRKLSGLDAIALGNQLDDALIDEIARRAHKQFVPLTNILVDPQWRREMVPVFVRRCLHNLVPSQS